MFPELLTQECVPAVVPVIFVKILHFPRAAWVFRFPMSVKDVLAAATVWKCVFLTRFEMKTDCIDGFILT